MLSQQQLWRPDSAAGKFTLTGFGALGWTYPGEKARTGFTPDLGLAYGAGATAAFGVMDPMMIFGGAEYASKPLFLNFIDILFGTHFFLSSAYLDLGGYYGFLSGVTDKKFKFDGINSEFNSTSAVNEDELKNDYGVLLGLGYIVKNNENLGSDLGVRAEAGLANVYDGGDSYFALKTTNISGNVGVTLTL